ncbi:hypothetical protein [Sulfurimonas sp.]|uniref:hypothetical protein n=1 Tax=Sulfurimonas sp. TaxID=2022749 RepID=UPI00286DA307|nr:hypothetical protein [Sulfurimonas sp.]
MKYEFIVYVDDAKSEKVFEAIATDTNKYDIIFDEANLFASTFLSILSGEYSVQYMTYTNELEPTSYEENFFRVEGNNYIQRLESYIQFQNNIMQNHTFDLNNNVEFCQSFGISLDGADFGYQEQLIKIETAIKVIDSANKIYQAAANNPKYTRYVREEAGSYEVHIDTLERDSHAIEVLLSIYNDIENTSLDRVQYATRGSSYRTIVEELNKLSKAKKLDVLSLFIDGEKKVITKTKYLQDFMISPYKASIQEYRGHFKSFDHDNKTFIIRGNQDWHCHLEEGSLHLFDQVKKEVNWKKIFVVIGSQTAPATLIVSQLTFE